jgi:hypothetical protein
MAKPYELEPGRTTDDAEKQQIFDELAEAFSEKIQDVASGPVRAQRMIEWQTAFNQSVQGSSYVRASLIGERIF